MGKIILITGGARSGKSSYAENLALKYPKDKVTYIATSLPLDSEMEDRIKKHQNRRPKNWITIENYSKIDHIIKTNKTSSLFLIDCVTIMITNLIFDFSNNPEDINTNESDKLNNCILDYIKNIILECKKSNSKTIFVTNELGMGLVPEHKLSRIFRDISGRVNQKLAASSNEVYFCVSGIPMQIK
jgi:adenosylcobinamide kinase/adenosylcobinamide-phosphate guanylyltransferase